MKIKITESQLKRIIEKYTEEGMINEAWYDGVLDKIGLNFDNVKDKVKDVFKKVTGIELQDKDEVEKKDIPSEKEIEKKIEDVKTDVEKDTKEKKDEKKTKTESGGTTVVIGGISYATANWMKSQWENAGLSTKNVEFCSIVLLLYQ